MSFEITKLLTQIVGLSKLMALAWAKQAVDLFIRAINFVGWVLFPGSDDHEPVQ